MTTRGEINSNFYQIVEVDANGAPTLVKPEYIGPVSQVDANISNVHISGGTNGYVLQTDGTGNLSWTAQTGGGGGNGVPGGSNTQVQFNDAGIFGGDDGFTYNKVTEVFTANNITGTELYVEGNIQSNTAVYVGYTANLTGLTNPTIIAKAAGATYVQAAIVNGTPEGSADYVTYGDNGSDSGAWADMGFTGSNFSDPLYTITGINDGYFFVQGDDSSAHGGNLVIATGPQGSTKDIVFGTGGFLANNEKMRFVHALSQFQIYPNTISTDETTGALVVTGGVGVGGNLNVAGNVSGNFIIGDGGYLSNVNFTGNVANANYANFAGNAISVQGGNVTGNVAQAVHSYFADVANSVSAANIVGIVGNATHANVSDVANSVSGSNVTGNVNQAVHAYFADTANSVAGANVTGVVANASYATFSGVASFAAVANSVAVSNVVGLGNVALLNLNGNSSQVLYGNGVFAGVSANISANFAAYAGNVTVNSQPNITSLGNLTSLNFDTTVTPITANVGQMFWDTNERTVTLGMENGVQQQIGLESYILVKASSAITDGQVVMFTGASGTNLTAAPANAASSGFKAGYILGIATQNIANNQFGYITTFGQVHGLNTIAWNLGDMLWYDPTSTTGAITNVQPVDPNFQIQVGYVTRKNASDGHIQVRLEPLTSLTNLTDVNITSPTIGQSIIYAGSNIWVNGDPFQANIANIAYSVDGANVTGQVSNALVSGTVYTNAQPNITSVGSLTGLVVSNITGVVNFTTTANVTLGSVANLHISGGTSGQFLTTNGSGTLSWSSAASSPGGANTQVQYNDGGVLGASNSFIFTNTSGSANLQLGTVTANSALVTLTSNNTLGGSRVSSIKKFGGITGINGLVITEDTKLTVFSPEFDVASVPIINLGDVANIHITGGTANYFLQTDGSGSLTWAPATGGGGGSPGGPVQSIQFNNYGLFDGTDDFKINLVDNIGDVPPTLIFGNNATSIGNTSWNGANLVLSSQTGNASFVAQKTTGLTITQDGISKINLVANTISLGSNANINITGGSTGQVLTTNGSGNLSWTTPPGGGGGSATDFTPSFLLGGM